MRVFHLASLDLLCFSQKENKTLWNAPRVIVIIVSLQAKLGRSSRVSPLVEEATPEAAGKAVKKLRRPRHLFRNKVAAAPACE